MKLLFNFSVEILLEKRYPTLRGFGLKFAQVHNFCHHLRLPQRTKTKFKNSFTIARVKFTPGRSHETEQRVNRSNNRTTENWKWSNQRQSKFHTCTKLNYRLKTK